MRKSKINLSLIALVMFVLAGPGGRPAQAAEPAKDAFIKGYAYIDINKPDLAVPHFDKAIELDDKYASAYRERGFAYYLQNEHLKAIADFRKALELNAQDAVAWNNMGLAYFSIRLLNMSKNAITRAVELDPDYAQAHLNLVHIYWLEGETDVFTEQIKERARYHLKQYLRIVPESEESKDAREKVKWLDSSIGTGDVLIVPDTQKSGKFSAQNMNKIKNWLADKPAAELDEKEHITLGVLLLRNGLVDLAADEFKAAVNLNPRNADVYMLLGGIYLKKGEQALAINYYSKSLEINPDSEQSSLGLGRAYLQSNNIKEAKQQINVLKKQNSILATTLEKEVGALK